MTVEERLAILEEEMTQMKRMMTAPQAIQNWIEKIKGSFKGDPDFGAILRLGREIRQADTPEDVNGDV